MGTIDRAAISSRIESIRSQARGKPHLWAALLLIVLIPIGECGLATWQHQGSPTSKDWKAIGDLIQKERAGNSAIAVVAEPWLRPLVQKHTPSIPGEVFFAYQDLLERDLSSEECAYRRLLYIGQQTSRPASERLLRSWHIGGNDISLYALSCQRRVAYDFSQHINAASVSFRSKTSAQDRQCRWTQRGFAPGGLNTGPMPPKARFECGTQSWQWVSTTYFADGELVPRYGIWAHPSLDHETSIRFDNIPAASTLELGGGLAYLEARHKSGASVSVKTLLDDQVIDETHFDSGQAWRVVSIALPEDKSITHPRPTPRSLTFVISSPDPTHRTFFLRPVLLNKGRAK